MNNPRNCSGCNLAWGALGILAGLVLLYMGADLITGGHLSAVLSGGSPLPRVSRQESDDE